MPKITGSLTAICGPMFSGKTAELIRRLRRAQIAGLEIQVFKHSLDTTRYAETAIVSHDGAEWQAIPVANATSIFNHLKPKTQAVAIDEAQFFGDEIVAVCAEMVEQGLRVIVAGLAMDFRGESFGPMPQLMARADADLVKLTAICSICGGDASYTQRILNGRPASYDSDLILVGGQEAYEARCRRHHVVPGKP